MKNLKNYVNPLVERYSSQEMNTIFSPQYKFSTWRRLWLYLAEAEKAEGLPITQKQIDAMRKHIDNIDFSYASRMEKKLRHDVMAHVHTYAKVCPEAASIIHLGVTSAYVADNTDLIQIKEAGALIRDKILLVIYYLKNFSRRYKGVVTLGYTHFQPAQPTTVGKRAGLWLQEFLLDYHNWVFFLDHQLHFRGVKGTTGTQASFRKLFPSKPSAVKRVEQYIARQFGFKNVFTVTGQTYTRKIDYMVSSLLSSTAQSAAKLASDIRLLSHKREIEEPFEENQIGSSAMAYKRNPMRSERVHSLARFIMALPQSTAYTASTQWFERTLDDSANKRLAIPQAFLAMDAVLDLLSNIVSGLTIYPAMIRKNLMEELPFIITENVLMESVKKGASRQKVHEVIRQLSWKVSNEIKAGGENRLVELMGGHKDIPLSSSEIIKLMDTQEYVGYSVELIERFIKEEISPILRKKRFSNKPSSPWV